MGFKHRYADVNDVTLHYVTEGEGYPIVFLHGFPACWYVWKPQLLHFGNSFQVIVPDGRGVNLSSKPENVAAYQIDLLAQDVIGLLDSLGIAKIALVGHDWGGVLAWKIAQLYSERVDKLVVVNAPLMETLLFALATIPEQQLASEYISRLKADTAETTFLANNCSVLWDVSFAGHMRNGNYDESDRNYYVESWQIPGVLTGFLNWYRANVPDLDTIVAAQYSPDNVSPIMVDSLLVWGEHEKAFTPQVLSLMPKYVRNLDIIHVQNADHWIALEQPTKFNKLVQDFLG
jgi:epoxide hydrolase 4